MAWKEFAVGLGPVGAVADALGPSLLQGAISGLMMALPGLIGSLGGVSGAMNAVGVAAHAMLGPLGLVTAAIALFATAYATNFMGFRDAVDTAVGWVVEKLRWLTDALWGAADAANKALGAFQNWVGNAMRGAMDSVQGFIDGICFAHAIKDAVESSKKDLGDFVSSVDSSMGEALGSIRGFNREAGLGIAGSLGAAATPPHLSLVFNAPLVNVEGSADERTAELAAEKVRDALRNVLVEASSGAAPGIHKRVRIGGLLNVA